MKLIQLPNGDWVNASLITHVCVRLPLETGHTPELLVNLGPDNTIQYTCESYAAACEARDDLAEKINERVAG